MMYSYTTLISPYNSSGEKIDDFILFLLLVILDRSVPLSFFLSLLRFRYILVASVVIMKIFYSIFTVQLLVCFKVILLVTVDVFKKMQKQIILVITK